MKKFSDIRILNEQPLSSGGGQGATYSVSPLGPGYRADEPEYAVHDVANPDSIRRLNVFLGSGWRAGMDPVDFVRQVQTKLSMVGLQFMIPAGRLKSKPAHESLDGYPTVNSSESNENSVVEEFPLSYLGGRFGVLDNNYTIGKDDGITNRIGRPLKLQVTYYGNDLNGSVGVRAKIVQGSINESTEVEEGIISGLASNLKKGAVSGAKDTHAKVRNAITDKAKNVGVKHGETLGKAAYKTGRLAGGAVGAVSGAVRGVSRAPGSYVRGVRQGVTGDPSSGASKIKTNLKASIGKVKNRVSSIASSAASKGRKIGGNLNKFASSGYSGSTSKSSTASPKTSTSSVGARSSSTSSSSGARSSSTIPSSVKSSSVTNTPKELVKRYATDSEGRSNVKVRSNTSLATTKSKAKIKNVSPLVKTKIAGLLTAKSSVKKDSTKKKASAKTTTETKPVKSTEPEKKSTRKWTV